MKIKVKKPVTAGQRNLVRIQNIYYRKNPLLKSQLKKLKKTTGRNNSGKQTVFHKGGGCAKRYRVINFVRNFNSEAIITSIEYDPYRTANIASAYDYTKNLYMYILAPERLKIGDIVKSGFTGDIKLGHSLPLSKIPVGSLIYNISLKKNRPASMVRSAGTFAFLLESFDNKCCLKIKSSVFRDISADCYASLGSVSNEFHFVRTLSKAGRSRWMNIRPTVRGVAMNPVDHPHGGGEGKKSGQKKTPWGKF